MRRYGSLLGSLMFLEAPSTTLLQRVSADKFVLSLRGQLRLIDLEAGSSGALRAASLLAALSRHLAVNASTVTVLAYYSCIDDVAAVREYLFMQSWSPSTDSRIVLLSIVIMKLFTQFHESLAWQPARDALSKVSTVYFTCAGMSKPQSPHYLRLSASLYQKYFCVIPDAVCCFRCSFAAMIRSNCFDKRAPLPCCTIPQACSWLTNTRTS
jgi:hypothetical protein